MHHPVYQIAEQEIATIRNYFHESTRFRIQISAQCWRICSERLRTLYEVIIVNSYGGKREGNSQLKRQVWIIIYAFRNNGKYIFIHSGWGLS
jgi:hypothetical protein